MKKYYGWFYFCPVYVYDPDSEAPGLEARHPILEPLFWLSERFGDLCCVAVSLLGYEPAWMIRVGGEVK